MLKIGLPAIACIVIGHSLGCRIFEKGKSIQIPASAEFILYAFLVLAVSLLTNENSAPFIYFQF